MPTKFVAKNAPGTHVKLVDDARGTHWVHRHSVPYLPQAAVDELPIEDFDEKPSLYLVGSLRKEGVPDLANYVEHNTGCSVFDSWFAAGPIADDSWQAYETQRGRSYRDALVGYAARHVFNFDRLHLDRCRGGILYLPAGKSGHLEAGYMCGQGKPVFILMEEEPERWDVMYQFCHSVSHTRKELVANIKQVFQL